MNGLASVSVGIVTYNNEDQIGLLLADLRRYCGDARVYVADNHSSDGTVGLIREQFPEVTLLTQEENRGFGAGHNKVLPLLQSDYHVIVNPDIRITSDVIGALAAVLDTHPDVSMITPKILNTDGTEQFLPKRKPRVRYMLAGRLEKFSKRMARLRNEYTMKNEETGKPMEIEFSTGCFSMIRTDVFRKLGGFDERFFMYLEDADLTLRARKFGKALFWPEVSVIHGWERSSAKKLKFLWIHMNSMKKFIKKWKNYTEGDIN